MRLDEVWIDESIFLAEGFKDHLGKTAAVGALGASILGGGFSNAPTVKTPVSQQQSINEPTTQPSYAIPELPKVNDDPNRHDNFPDELVNQRTVSPKERVTTFIKYFLPLVDNANGQIAVQRQYLDHITRPGYNRSDEELSWISKMMRIYNASTVNELYLKLDEVPRSMALAQAAIESGWGTSDIARKGNAFYGQKTWNDNNSIKISDKERYSKFDNPIKSISGYIHNLNTHPAYADFRAHRAAMRSNNQPLSGPDLMKYLSKYSTKKSDYISQVTKLINSERFKNLD